MNYRRLTSRACWLLIAVVVLVHVGLYVMRPRDSFFMPGVDSSEWRNQFALPRGENMAIETFGDGLVFCQLMALTTCAVLGSGLLRTRLVIVAAVGGLWGLMWLRGWEVGIGYGSDRLTAEAILLRIGCAGLLAATVLRMCGWRFSKPSDERMGAVRPPQFTLRLLLAATAGIAALAAGMQWCRRLLEWADKLRLEGDSGAWTAALGLTQELRIEILAAPIVLSCLAGFWAVAGRSPLWLRLAATILMVPMLAICLQHISGARDEEFWLNAMNLSIALGADALLTAVTVLPLCCFGFALVRPARLSAELRL